MEDNTKKQVPAERLKFCAAGFTADDEPTEKEWDSLIYSLIIDVAAEDIKGVMDKKGKGVLHIFTPLPGSVDAEAMVTDTEQFMTTAAGAGIPPVEPGCLLVLAWQPLCDPAFVGKYKLLFYCSYRRSTRFAFVVQSRQVDSIN